MAKTYQNLQLPASSNVKDTYNRINQNSDALDSDLTEIYVDTESLQGQIDAIEAADSNAQIGVYSLDATGTDTLTASYTGLTYFTGLKVNLTIANNNTGATTLNINSLGAKSIKFLDGTELNADNLKQDYIYQLEYNGTDFVLLSTDGIKANNKIDNSFYADIDAYYGNVKTIDDGQDLASSVVGSQSLDTVNVKIGVSSLRVTETDNIQTLLEARDEGVNLDFTKLNNGEASTDDDYISLVFYVSDPSKVDSTIGIRFGFSQGVTYDPANEMRLQLQGTLDTGWNYIKVKKSSFSTLGGGSWSGIQSFSRGWYSTTNAINAYVSFQSIQLVKKDPLEDYPNPFQRFGVRDFAINSGEWFVGEEFGNGVVLKELSGTTTDANSLEAQNAFNDFTINSISVISGSVNAGSHTAWYIDTNNYIWAFIAVDTLYLRKVESGVTNDITTSFAVNEGDNINIKLAKSGSHIKVIATSSSLEKQLSTTTTLTTLKGVLCLGALTGSLNLFKTASITEIAHASHSYFSETSKGLVKQSSSISSNGSVQSIATGTSDVLVSLDTDSEDYFFDSSSPTQRTIRESGKYIITANADYIANATGSRDLKIKVDSTQISHDSKLASNALTTGLSCSAVRFLNVGDIVTITTWQNSGTSLNITAKLEITKVF